MAVIKPTWQAIWSVPTADLSVYGSKVGSGTLGIASNVLSIPYQTRFDPTRLLDTPTTFEAIQAAAGTFQAEDPGAGLTVTWFYAIGTGAGNEVLLKLVRVDATHYTITLADTGSLSSAGTTQFLFGTAYPWLLEQNGTTWRLWFGSSATPECSFAKATQCLSFGVAGPIRLGDQGATADVTKKVYLSPIWVGSYDTIASRPDPSAASYDKLGLGAGTPLFTGWASGTGAGDYLEADDWLTGNSDTTTYWGHAGVASAQYDRTAETVNPTVSGTIFGVATYFLSLVATAGKTNTIGALISDGGSNTVYGTRENDLSTTYGPHGAIHVLDPAGAAWAAAGLNSLEIGASTIVWAAAANGGRLTAIQGEVIGFTVGFAPGVPSATRRRALAAQIV